MGADLFYQVSFWANIATVLTLFIAVVPGIIYAYKRLSKRVDNGNEAAEKLRRIRKLSNRDDQAIWGQDVVLTESYHDAIAKSIPILMVANLKGGVGKTTIAGNLAAYFAEQNLRVLAIDLDYQGSLTSMMLEHKDADLHNLDKIQEKATHLLEGVRGEHWAKEASDRYKDDLKLRFVGAHYNLAAMENRLMLRWLIDETEGDIRFNLAKYLLNDDFQKQYDVIIIDTAPRLTTAFVNALCTSTHLLIPSVLDNLSASSIKDFLTQLRELKPKICPHLELAGIAGSMTHYNRNAGLTEREQQVTGVINMLASKVYGPGEHVISDYSIPQMAKISHTSGWGLAYLQDDAVKHQFATLGQEIGQRIGLFDFSHLDAKAG